MRRPSGFEDLSGEMTEETEQSKVVAVMILGGDRLNTRRHRAPGGTADVHALHVEARSVGQLRPSPRQGPARPLIGMSRCFQPLRRATLPNLPVLDQGGPACARR